MNEPVAPLIAAPAPVDLSVPAIGEALRYIQMSGVFYCPSELTEPWGLELPPMPDCVWFHAVLRGEFNLEVESVRGKGYRIPGGIDLLDAGQVIAALTEPARGMLAGPARKASNVSPAIATRSI